jgi:hypothetical protein
VQTVSLVGHVIEDLTYEPVQPSQFEAELLGAAYTPQYKPDGFFVFSNVAPGTYTLRLSGQRFQPWEQTVEVPAADLVINGEGDNEVLVIASAVNSVPGNNGGPRLLFNMVYLEQPVRAGAAILTPGFSAMLAIELDRGRTMEARIENVTGTLTPNAVVRIVRDQSLRLKVNPYSPLPLTRTRLVGTVVRQNAPEVRLSGAQVRLTQVNGVIVESHDIAGLEVASVGLNGTTVILGTERDVTTLTNDNGDYNLYFDIGEVLEDLTVEVALTGYEAAMVTVEIRAGQRQRLEVPLIEA